MNYSHVYSQLLSKLRNKNLGKHAVILVYRMINGIIVYETVTTHIILQDNSVTVEAQTTVSQASVESVMRAIRQRLKARIALCRQVQALGKMPCNYYENPFDIAVLV
jgi:hypothetical protein